MGTGAFCVIQSLFVRSSRSVTAAKTGESNGIKVYFGVTRRAELISDVIDH